MLTPVSLPAIETLFEIIFNQYLYTSYCLTFIAEQKLDFNIPISYTYIIPENEHFVNKLLNVSEQGCSDYVVLMREPKEFMLAYEKVTHLGNVRRSDRKLIFLPFENENNTMAMLKILSMKETNYVANVLLVTASKNAIPGCETFDLITHKFVGSEEEAQQPLFLDKWDSCSAKFDLNANLFPNFISNLFGKKVKVSAFTYKPYVLLDLDTNIEPLGRDGMEMRIVDEFCRWINCSVEIVGDGGFTWGQIFENGTGVGVLGNVVEDRADIGITALYSWYEEYKVLDFSAPSVKTSITCIAPAPRLLSSWELPLLPFSWIMWLCLIFTFLYASLALAIAKGCTTDRVLLTTFGMMLTQSQPDDGGSWHIRRVTGWMLVTGLVIDNAYGAGLASTFTVPTYEPSIDTVQDLIDRKMEWGATHDAWIFSLTLSPEPRVKQLVSQFRIYSAEQLKENSFKRKMAFSVEKLPAGYFAIGDYITKEAARDSVLMLEDFYYEQCVVMMRKSSPYTDKISELIGRLHQSGLMLTWETQIALKYMDFDVQLEVKLSRTRRDVDEIEPLHFRQVVGIFIIHIMGVIISIIIFIIEKVLNKTKTKKNTTE